MARQAQNRAGTRSQRRIPAADDRRQEILKVAAQVFADKGFVNATVRDIGVACGMLSGSLYYHFDSKESMLEELLRELLDELVAQFRVAASIDADAGATLRELMRVGLDAIVAHPLPFRILHNDHTYLQRTERFRFVESLLGETMKIWTQTVQRGVREGTFRKDADVTIVCRVMLSTIWSTVRWRSMPTTRMVDRLVEELSRLFIDGLRD